MKKIASVLAFAAVAQNALAAVPKDPFPSKFVPAPTAQYPVAAFNEKTFAQLEKDAIRRGSRSIASTPALNDSVLSGAMKEIRDQIIGKAKIEDGKAVKDARGNPIMIGGIDKDHLDQLDALLKKAEGEAYLATLPNDARYALAQLQTLRAFKGFVYRVRPYFEKAKILHSTVLSSARMAIQGVQIYLPTDQWDAVTKYVTEPQDDMEPFTVRYEDVSKASECIRVYTTAAGDKLCSKLMIVTSDDVQYFFMQNVFPRVYRAEGQLHQMANDLAKGKNAAPFYVDNKIFYGPSSFGDNLDRYRRVGVAEVNATLAGLNGSLASMTFNFGYAMTDALAVAEGLGKLYGVDGFWNDVQGGPARDRVEVINDRGAKFLVKHEREKKAAAKDSWIARSFDYVKWSAYYGILAYQELKDRESSTLDGLNAAWVKPYGQKLGLTIEKVKKMLKGPTELTSLVTGKTVTVDLPAFYANSPDDLKAFLPTGFEKGDRTLTKKIRTPAGTTEEVEYRNYREGSANAWNLGAYKPYLPSVSSNEDLKDAAQVLSQAIGGFMFGSLSGAML